MASRTSLEQWSVLAALIDHGGFAQAGVALHRSQSAVSYAVARLQEAIGVPLLTTVGRRSLLTDEGRLLLDRARAVLKDLERLERLAESLQRGWEPELRLVVDAAFPWPCLLDILSALQRSCPNTRIELTDAILSGAEDAIIGGQADLVVTAHVPPGFTGDRLLEVRFVAVARPDHALFQLDRPVTMDDLTRHVQSVVRDSGTARRRDDGWLGSLHRFTVGSLDAALATVLAGLAYAWLPEHMLAASLAEGKLRALPLVSGATRHVALSLVAVNAELLGPAGLRAVQAFHEGAAGRSNPTGENRPRY